MLIGKDMPLSLDKLFSLKRNFLIALGTSQRITGGDFLCLRRAIISDRSSLGIIWWVLESG